MDRGFGRCFVIKKFNTTIKKYSSGTTDKTSGAIPAESFPGLDKDPKFKRQQYIDPDGICQVGTTVEPNYVLVNKASPTSTDGEFKPVPLTYKGAAPAIVDRVLISTSNESSDLIVKVGSIKLVYLLIVNFQLFRLCFGKCDDLR